MTSFYHKNKTVIWFKKALSCSRRDSVCFSVTAWCPSLFWSSSCRPSSSSGRCPRGRRPPLSLCPAGKFCSAHRGRRRCRRTPWWRRWCRRRAGDWQRGGTRSTETQTNKQTNKHGSELLFIMTTTKNDFQCHTCSSPAPSATISTITFPKATVRSQPAWRTDFMLVGAWREEIHGII